MKLPQTVIALSLGVASMVAAQGGSPAPPPLVKEGATVKVGPHTYVIPDDNVGMVPNVGIVVGSRATLVIDPGMGKRNTLGYLGLPNAKYINSNVQEAEFASGWEQQAKVFAARGPVQAELLQGATGRKADVSYDREYTLDLGDVRVRMIVVGPTHTRGDTMFFVEGDRVLFAGDVIMNESFVAATAGSSMRAWLAAFDLADRLQPTVIVPSHGKVGDRGLIAGNRAFMTQIRARAAALKAEGRSADEAAAAVQKEMQAEHPSFARVNGVAAAARAAYAEAP